MTSFWLCTLASENLCLRLLYKQKNCEPFSYWLFSHKKKMSIYRLGGWHDIMVQCWTVSAQARLNQLSVFWRVYPISVFSTWQSWRAPLASILLIASSARFSRSQSNIGTHGKRLLQRQKKYWSILSPPEESDNMLFLLIGIKHAIFIVKCTSGLGDSRTYILILLLTTRPSLTRDTAS